MGIIIKSSFFGKKMCENLGGGEAVGQIKLFCEGWEGYNVR